MRFYHMSIPEIEALTLAQFTLLVNQVAVIVGHFSGAGDGEGAEGNESLRPSLISSGLTSGPSPKIDNRLVKTAQQMGRRMGILE